MNYRHLSIFVASILVMAVLILAVWAEQTATAALFTGQTTSPLSSLSDPYMVKDINTLCTSDHSDCGSNLYDLIIWNRLVFFAADDKKNGKELWKSDGTESGTMLVKDIHPGVDGSFPANFIDCNGILLFSVGDETNGAELWKSDGTATGTIMVKDITPGSAGSFPSQFVNMNGVCFFNANDGVHGDELWRSDGSAAGTIMVKDVNPDTTGTGYVPTNFINVNGIFSLQQMMVFTVVSYGKAMARLTVQY